MKTFKRILVILLVILIIMQFFRPEKNLSAQASPNYIALHYNVPADVKSILAKACNDCHSNNTRYPWYANFQPVAWWLDDHVREGKRELNFSEFYSYRIGKQYRRMESTIDLIKKDAMPLASYTIVHKDAILNDAEKATLINWAQLIRDTIRSKYPPDSLIRKK